MRHTGIRAASVSMAIFTLVCLVALGWLVTVIGNVRWGASDATYTAVFADASGLLVNDDVKIAGVPVGKVSDISVERGLAVVTFGVDDEVVLPEGTEIVVRWRNALGLRHLELEPAGSGQLPQGHRFDVEATSAPADLDAFVARLTPVMRALDPDVANELVRELATALGGREQEVGQLVRDAADVLQVVGERDQAIGQALQDGTVLAEAYVARRDTLLRLLSDAADLGEALSERSDILLDAVVDIVAVEDELESLLADNDELLRELGTDVDRVLAILRSQEDDVLRILETTGPAIVQYHRISRWGQWFNIRVPVLTVSEIPIASERGASLPARGDGIVDPPPGTPQPPTVGQAPPSSLSPIFQVGAPEGGR